jgi:hypothetical protein
MTQMKAARDEKEKEKAAKAPIAANKTTEIEQNRIEREQKRAGRAAEQEAKQASKAAKALKRANSGDDSGRGIKKEQKNRRPYCYQSPVCYLFLWSALSVE